MPTQTNVKKLAGAAHHSALRRDPRRVDALFKLLFHDPAARKITLESLSADIKLAHRIAPASWGVSIFPNTARLNVGGMAVLHIYEEQIAFSITKSLQSSVPKDARALFDRHGEYSFVPGALEGSLSAAHVRQFPAFKAAHHHLVERCAQKRKVCFWPHSHSPGFVRFMRQSGYDIPDPDYVLAAPRAGKLLDLDEIDHATKEGRLVLRTHLTRERDPQMALRKKELVFRQSGKLSCEVCHFDFESVYGSIGHAFAEVHHTEPLGAGTRQRVTRLKDLAIVCSNCHRMLHRGKPVFSIKELIARLKR